MRSHIPAYPVGGDIPAVIICPPVVSAVVESSGIGDCNKLVCP